MPPVPGEEVPPEEAMGKAVGQSLQMVGTFIIAITMAFVFGFLGSLTAPGVGALIGGMLGLILGCIIGLIATGKGRDAMSGFDDIVDVGDFLGGSSGHDMFTMFVGVHELIPAKGTESSLPFGIAKPDFFVRLKCGNNPLKQTVVREIPVWNEHFKLTVMPKDTVVSFEILDQNNLIDSSLGNISIPIKLIVNEGLDNSGKHRGWPKMEFKVRSASHATGTLIISFRAGEGTTFKSSQGDFAPGRVFNASTASQSHIYGTFRTQSQPGGYRSTTASSQERLPPYFTKSSEPLLPHDAP